MWVWYGASLNSWSMCMCGAARWCAGKRTTCGVEWQGNFVACVYTIRKVQGIDNNVGAQHPSWKLVDPVFTYPGVPNTPLAIESALFIEIICERPDWKRVGCRLQFLLFCLILGRERVFWRVTKHDVSVCHLNWQYRNARRSVSFQMMCASL